MLDFDAFRAEHQAVTRVAPSVKVGGVVYTLPPALPAVVALDILRARRDKGEEAPVPPEAINDICDALFGQETFRDLVISNQLTIDDLGLLVLQVLKMYEDTGTSGNAPPNRETRRKVRHSRSSSNGRT